MKEPTDEQRERIKQALESRRFAERRRFEQELMLRDAEVNLARVDFVARTLLEDLARELGHDPARVLWDPAKRDFLDAKGWKREEVKP